ncbi:MAG: cytochrome c3 family protein [Verrucomicrobiota bacterium]
MAQLFHRKSNTIARASIVVVLILLGGAGWLLHAVYWSPYTTQAKIPIKQTVPFSHEHHVRGLGLDCRFCHTTVEKSAFAGIPSTTTCMTCHSQVWKDAPMLAPIRESFARNERLQWNRVNDLPDFVFFNHSIHVNKGVGCATCHGPVNEMPLMWQEHTLFMKWCLECHRAPENFIRPREEVFNLNWKSTNQVALGVELVKKYHINTTQLTDCSMCHR